MVEFEDPITDTDYDTGNPAAFGMQMLKVLAGITLTLVAFSIAQTNIVPRITGFLGSLTGMSVGGNETIEVA